jgi:hypothetical protein
MLYLAFTPNHSGMYSGHKQSTLTATDEQWAEIAVCARMQLTLDVTVAHPCVCLQAMAVTLRLPPFAASVSAMSPAQPAPLVMACQGKRNLNFRTAEAATVYAAVQVADQGAVLRLSTACHATVRHILRRSAMPQA